MKVDLEKPWLMTLERYAFEKGVHRPHSGFCEDCSFHQLAGMSERAIKEAAKNRINGKMAARDRWVVVKQEWEAGIIEAYKSGKFWLNDVYDKESFYVVRDYVESCGVDILSPFKIHKLGDEKDDYLERKDYEYGNLWRKVRFEDEQ